MSKQPSVTKEIFVSAKAMLKELPAKQVSTKTGLSYGTVYLIAKSKTLEAYKKLTLDKSRAAYENRLKREQELKQTVPKLKKQVDDLREENARLRGENDSLKSRGFIDRLLNRS